MRDKELAEWTCRGLATAGFFVATVEGEVVGCGAYRVQVVTCSAVCAVLQCNQGVQERDLVMCRLATEARYRGRGVASQLLARLERTASILGCGRVTLETSTSHEAAVRLYTRRGYTQVLGCIYVSVECRVLFAAGCLYQLLPSDRFCANDFVREGCNPRLQRLVLCGLSLRVGQSRIKTIGDSEGVKCRLSGFT